MDKDTIIRLTIKNKTYDFTIEQLEKAIIYADTKILEQQKWISILLKQIKKWKLRYRHEKAKKEQNMR